MEWKFYNGVKRYAERIKGDSEYDKGFKNGLLTALTRYDADSSHSELEKEWQQLQKENTGLKEIIEKCRCPKCDKAMYDTFSGSFHNIDNCGKSKPAVAISTENA